VCSFLLAPEVFLFFLLDPSSMDSTDKSSSGLETAIVVVGTYPYRDTHYPLASVYMCNQFSSMKYD
jgi:hypothetical protein